MKKTGSVKTAKTVKAGCGIRYDPEELGEETAFDFSSASTLLEEAHDAHPVKADARSNAVDRTVPNQGDGGD